MSLAVYLAVLDLRWLSSLRDASWTTILRWHRLLIAGKWDYSDRRKTIGRPRIPQVIVELILRFAKENPSWGYDRIQGALANVGHHISDTTVGNVLKAHGIDPAPDRRRQTTWKTFLRAHWDVLAAVDFTTMEVWTQGRTPVVQSQTMILVRSPWGVAS